jgi:uncharacterized membrane protein required for colicin V production
MIWIDYVLIFILIMNLYKGLREGLLRQVASLAGFFIAFYAALCWCCKVRGFFEKYLKMHKVVLALSQGDTTSDWLVDATMNLLAFLVLFFIFYFVLKYFGKRLRILNRVPIIGPVNALLGAAAGGVKGLLIMFLIISLLTLIKTEFWMNTMESSAVVALSNHYIPLLYGFIFDHVMKRLGTFV